MRFGWARAFSSEVGAGSRQENATKLICAATAAAILLLAACGKTEAPPAGADPAKNAEVAAAWMAKNAKEPGVQTLPSGLQYKVVQSGPSGAASPDRNDLVRVDYEGALTNGTVFDSSFQRGVPYATHVDEVVPGWIEALQRMKAGDEWVLYVPPALGYGAVDKGDIPANSVMVFRIKLLDIAPVPGGTVRGVGMATG
ncbi:FKBP-type peptidyl-prolyl cis-trans isomerase [soil metagenome]